MPQLTSPLSTPTGMPALNTAHLGKAAGLRIHFATFADFTAAITTGTASYAADLWSDGQEMTIASESDAGALRIWRTSLGHARTVRVFGRIDQVLPANTNVALAAAGLPVGGTGNNGDLSVDRAAGIVYLKTGGTWASVGSVSLALTPAAAAAAQAAFDAPRPSFDFVTDFATVEGRLTPSEAALRTSAGAPSVSDLASKQYTLPIRTVLVSATGTIAIGACAVVGIQAITLGTGSLTLHDAVNTAADATLLRFERAMAMMVAGGYYPMVADEPAAMLMERGVFVSVPAGGVYAIDLVDERNLANVESVGLLCMPLRVAATGLVANGRTSVVSVKVIAPGTLGGFSLHESSTAADALKLRYPVTAFGSLVADQTIRLGPRGCAASFAQIFVTVPTGGIVLINTLPR